MSNNILRTALLAAALISAGWTGGCTGAPDPEQLAPKAEQLAPIVAWPAAMALRPGEADRLRYSRLEGGTAAVLPPVADAGLDWLNLSAPEPCTPGSTTCQTLTLTSRADGHDGVAASLLVWWRAPEASQTQTYSEARVNPFPASTPAAPPATRFTAGSEVSLALDAEGAVWGWGWNGARLWGDAEPAQAGLRSQPLRLRFANPVPPLDAIAVSKDVVGYGAPPFVVALDREGRVWSWGLDPARGRIADAEPVPGLPGGMVAVAAGTRHALVLHRDGSVSAWGRNRWGELGVEDRDHQGPVRVPDLPPIVAVAAGDGYSMALDAVGRVWTWGLNDLGQLGGVRHLPSAQPGAAVSPAMSSDHRKQIVQGIGPVSAIAAGPAHALALRVDGSVWAWGRGDAHRLGAAATAQCLPEVTGSRPIACSHQPLHAAPGLTGVDMIAAGESFNLARRSDGSVWAWGSNQHGELGQRSGTGGPAAVQVASAGPVVAIAAGKHHALAMPADQSCSLPPGRVGGRLMAWGSNQSGERGDGTGFTAPRATPVLTLGDDDTCPSLGQRLVVMLSGTAPGTLDSSQPGLACTLAQCWQTVARGVDVTLTAHSTPPGPSDWRWDCANGTEPGTGTVTMDAVRHCKVRFGATPERTEPLPPTTTATLTVGISGQGRVLSTPAGLDCTAGCSAPFGVGTAVTLSALPAEGWRLHSFGGSDGCDTGRLTMQADRACHVAFEPVPSGTPVTWAELMLAVGNGGSVRVAPAGLDCSPGATCTRGFPAGTRIELTPLPEPGHRFVGFGGQPLCSSGVFVLSAYTACLAHFEPVPPAEGWRLNVLRSGPGAADGQVVSIRPDDRIQCGTVCSAHFDAGATVLLKPRTTRSDGFFSRFSGCTLLTRDEDGEPLCQVVMNGDHTVTAEFE